MNEAHTQTALYCNAPLESPAYTIGEDGRVHFCLKAPNAREVVLKSFSEAFPLTKAEDGNWTGEFDIGRGFIYLFVEIDGASVLWPYLPIGYGCSRPMNFVDVPTEETFYLMKDVPHGCIEQICVPSTVTGRTESCLCYLPPEFDPNEKYPVLYLQHGHGENETGWVFQGKINLIADNLLAEKRMKPMIIAMANGMLQKDGEYQTSLFPEYLMKDVMPCVESRYPILRDRDSRAMAGLSMGSMHTSVTTLTHPESFAWIGLFSGFLRTFFKGDEQLHLRALDDREAFLSGNRLFFRAMGDTDPFLPRFIEDDEILKQKGIETDRRIYAGGNVWQVWRSCAKDFLQLLFQ